MRKSPQRLAFLLIAITITRVALLVVFGMKVGPLGYVFAVAVAAGVYVGAYFLRFKETRWAAFLTLILFAGADLFFNVLESVRSLSTEALVATDANFIGIGAEDLRHLFQRAALVFAAFPTIAAASLGWLQSGAERVAVLKSRAWFGKFGVAIMARMEKVLPEIEDRAANMPGATRILPASSAQPVLEAGKIRWEDLLASDKDFVAAHSTRQIVAQYGISDRTARNWKSRITAGE